MVDVFFYLFVCSFRNRVRVRLRRLRQPRYLVGSIVGAVYLYLMVFRRLLSHPGRTLPPGLQTTLDRLSGPIEFVGTMVLFVVAAAAWVTPGAGTPIEFTRAETQFLFQAPVTRRQLLHYKLLRGQIGAVFSSVVATILLRPASFAEAWTVMLGISLLFTIVRMHLTGVALRRHSLAQHGRSGLVRQWLPLVAVTTAVLVLATEVVTDWPAIARMTSAYQVFEELRRLAGTGASQWILWPFRAAVRLPLAGTPQKFLAALPAMLVLLALNYLWVLRGDTAFEEASAAYAERRATDRNAPSAARRNGKPLANPFALALSGRPETVILWKNLILFGRYASMRTLRRFVPVVVVLVIVMSRSRGSVGIASLVSGLSLVLATLTVLIGPQIVTNDLRQDLASLAVLKSWPVRGAALVRGELLAPGAILTVATWLLILTAALCAGSEPGGANPLSFEVARPVVLALVAGLLAPALILPQLVLQNGMAILFPAWVVVGTSRARGIDAMGQRLLMMAGVIVTLVTALLPAAVAAGLVGLAIYAITQTIPIVIPALTLALVMFGECWIAAELLGRVLDRTDVGALEAVE
jgi:hypothetical protein